MTSSGMDELWLVKIEAEVPVSSWCAPTVWRVFSLGHPSWRLNHCLLLSPWHLNRFIVLPSYASWISVMADLPYHGLNKPGLLCMVLDHLLDDGALEQVLWLFLWLQRIQSGYYLCYFSLVFHLTCWDETCCFHRFRPEFMGDRSPGKPSSFGSDRWPAPGQSAAATSESDFLPKGRHTAPASAHAEISPMAPRQCSVLLGFLQPLQQSRLIVVSSPILSWLLFQ